MNLVHVVLPNDIDDPATPSGGNTYDRRICRELSERGWLVHEHPVHGDWPTPTEAATSHLGRLLGALPDGAAVLLDGLVASAAPDALVPQSGRLRLVVLVHMPIADAGEVQALSAADAVVTTSEWTRRHLLARYDLPAERVHVAPPGVDLAPLSPGTPDGRRLLCVAAVTPQKGYDVLVDALAATADLPWTCNCVGALTRAPDFVTGVRAQLRELRLDGRVRLVGPHTRDELADAYDAADLLVLASRAETYGMVVAEALARGTPVVATTAGGLPEALARAPDGHLPGILVEPGDPLALAGALRRWLTDPDLRGRLRQAARQRRSTLAGWAGTAQMISTVLAEASATCGRPA